MKSRVHWNSPKKARYEASRIERQYQATEPENRLVAAELEKRWNNALTHVTEMEQRLQEASALTRQLTVEQRQQLLALGDDLEQLWDHLVPPSLASYFPSQKCSF